MKADEKKPEAASKYCKDCMHYSKPICNQSRSELRYVARKSTCPEWARRK